MRGFEVYSVSACQGSLSGQFLEQLLFSFIWQSGPVDRFAD